VYENASSERTRTGVIDGVIRILSICKNEESAALHSETVELFGVTALRDIGTLKVAKPARLFALDFVDNFASIATNIVSGVGVSRAA
jgi:hypothetical protein